MKDVSDESVEKVWAEEEARKAALKNGEPPPEPPKDELAEKRTWYMDKLLAPYRPRWRSELAHVEPTVPKGEPIEGLEPKAAAALVWAMENKDLEMAVRRHIYPVFDRVKATAELV